MKLNEVFIIKEANDSKSIVFTAAELVAIIYCCDYANEKDDE